MNQRNYNREMDQIIEDLRREGKTPTLLLQACCAPCSSACLERLREDFLVTVLYYNPNITEEAEYEKRKEEEKRLIAEYNREVAAQDFEGMKSTGRAHEIKILDCDHDAEKYLSAVRGLENCPEGGERCGVCFRLRLRKTAELARAYGCDFCSTTLTISPLKSAERLNRIGEEAAAEYGVRWLPSDFKKKDGYKRSIELSHRFGLYRQNYCGCVFSKRDAVCQTQAESV
ncbi:hypothetical protein SAMN02745687_02486 [Lachnospiraceae bacterium NK3A20]|nr:hypothetical protein SAMN02745687_02486 [Lachnospiraceae bacterium NK3A20]